MSRSKYAICLGLVLSGWSTTSYAQQSDGFVYEQGQYPAAQYSANPSPSYPQSQNPVYQQPVYQHPVNQSTQPMHQAGFHRSAPQHYYQNAPQHYANCGPYGSCGNQQEPSSFWTNYYRNVHWPTPFRAHDVSTVASYFDIQRENGWRMHNTVGHAMFDPRTNCLTQAGKNHIQSILRDNPSDRKVVFVLQGQNQQQTASRVQSTELAISEILPVGDLPPVYVTDRDAPGSSGAYQTSVMQAMKASIPSPRLTSASGGTAPSGTP